MLIREVQAKSILTRSQLTDYCINCYMGCSFGCSYCYAQLIIRKFHPGEAWGGYLDVKINAPQQYFQAALDRKSTRLNSSH